MLLTLKVIIFACKNSEPFRLKLIAIFIAERVEYKSKYIGIKLLLLQN